MPANKLPMKKYNKAITKLHEILKRQPENRQWIQQDKERVMEYKTKLMKLAYIMTGHAIFLEPPEKVHPFSSAGRLLNDGDNRELDKAWNRLMCMDDQFREYSQPFYACNPQTGQKECTEITDDLWDWIDKEGLVPKSRPLTTTEIGNRKLTIGSFPSPWTKLSLKFLSNGFPSVLFSSIRCPKRAKPWRSSYFPSSLRRPQRSVTKDSPTCLQVKQCTFCGWLGLFAMSGFYLGGVVVEFSLI